MNRENIKLFIKKIKSKNVNIGIIGLGYVGLPLALLFANKDFRVTGFVRNEKKALDLMSGINHLSDPNVGRVLKKVLKKKKLLVTKTSTKYLQDQDIIIICVPTPVNENKKPDLRDLKAVSNILSRISITNKLIINESTVAPYTTRQIFGSLGSGYFLACSPERIDPGNKSRTVESIPKIIGGIDEESAILGEYVYSQILDKNLVRVSSLEAAEMTKMMENAYRAVNIAFVNEFAKLCERCNLDILEIINAAKSKWSYHPHYPGLGVGGHCIPVDPYYILELAQKKGLEMKIINDGLEVNESMPSYVMEKVKKVYKKGMKVLVYGLTYKRDVNDLRESPVLRLCSLLNKFGINFEVYDPYVTREDIIKMDFKIGKLENVDMLIIGADHSTLTRDSKLLIGPSTIVIDGRNFFTEKTGTHVVGVGRESI